MTYRVHFTVPFDTRHDGIWLNPEMQEYEGKQVTVNESLNLANTAFCCTPKGWTPASSRPWIFHIDWLTPIINLL